LNSIMRKPGHEVGAHFRRVLELLLLPHQALTRAIFLSFPLKAEVRGQRSEVRSQNSGLRTQNSVLHRRCD
jgi:hypothetical protein